MVTSIPNANIQNFSIMCKESINNRTIQAINYLLDNKPGLTKSAMADSFGISPSKFSEILKERMNAGTEIMSKLSSVYSISATRGFRMGRHK